MSNSILSYTEPLKIIHVRHRKVWNVKRKKSHTCGIHMLSFFLHTLLKLSATQHTRWWGRRVATAAEDEEKKKKSCFWNPSYRISSAVCSVCWAEENGESGVFLWHTPVEESEAAAKQKWQRRFGIRVSSCTQLAAEEEKGKRGRRGCVPVGRGQLAERRPRGPG